MSTSVSSSAQSAAPASVAPPPRSRARVSAPVVLAAVCLLYVLAQLVLFSLDRALSWDEVVYLAQTAPGETGMDWGPQRARGMALLVAPVALAHAPTAVVRAYLIAVSGAGLYLAYRAWVPVLGHVAGLAAFVFGFSWVGLYFGMEVFPNLPAAFASVGTVGAVAAYVRTGRRGWLVAAAVALALVTLFRPPDSVWLAAALMLGVVVAAWRRAPAVAAALFAGGVAGWAPWLIEMGVRYGGPLGALRAARTESVSGPARDRLDQYLNLVEGPVRLIVRDPTLTHRALVVLVAVAILVAVALVQRSRLVARRGAVLATLTALGGLAPYLVLSTGVNLRYLLPAWSLTAIAVAVGLAAIADAAGRRLVLGGALVVVVLAWAVLQVGLAARNARIAEIDQIGMYLLAEELEAEVGDGPCAVATEFAFPQLAWATDCITLELDVDGESGQCPGGSHSLDALARDGYDVVVMHRSEMPMIADWDRYRTELRDFGPWKIATPPDGDPTAVDVPRLPGPGEASVPCPLSRAPDATEIAPLRIGPRLPDDTTIRYRERRLNEILGGSST